MSIIPVVAALGRAAVHLRQPEYFIPVGNRQVLISLATHLDNHQIAEMAIAKVVERISHESVQTACILSLQHAIILEIDKSCQPTKVKRTKTLRILDDDKRQKGSKSIDSHVIRLSPICPSTSQDFFQTRHPARRNYGADFQILGHPTSLRDPTFCFGLQTICCHCLGKCPSVSRLYPFPIRKTTWW